MRTIVQTSILAFFFFAVTSCNDDETNVTMSCITNSDLGEFTLLESSKSFIPYGDEELTLVFSDSLGVEYRGRYVPGVPQTCERTGTYLLEPNTFTPSNTCFYQYSTECQYHSIFFEDFGELEVLFGLEVDVAYSVIKEEALLSDQLKADVFSEGSDSSIDNLIRDNFSQFLKTINRRNNDENNTAYLLSDASFNFTFELHDKVYENVYTSKISRLSIDQNEFFDIYYSSEVGIVGFESMDKSISLKFERVE